MNKITPFLWFDNEAGEAAKFYTSIFKDSKIIDTTTLENTPSGTVEIVRILLLGQEFQLMSAGPLCKFNEAISFVVHCENQTEVDHFWEELTAGGKSGQCGWLQDKYGVSWQIVPDALGRLMQGPNPVRSERVMRAMLQMQKLDIAGLQQAYDQQ